MRQVKFKLAALTSAALLAACGGGDSTPAPTVVTPTLAGVAATGAALANATVTAKCASGAALTGTTGADGSFSLTMSGGQVGPCMVQVTNGTVTLHGFALTSGRVNVTPMSDLVITKALGSDAAAAFASFDTTKAGSISAALDAAKTYVNTEITALTGSALSGDILTGVFKVGDADDKVLDKLGASLKDGGKTLDDIRLVASSGISLTAAVARGSLVEPAAVLTTLTAAQIDAGTQSSGLQGLSGKAKCDVKVVALNYNTIGVKGEKANASGVMLVPSGAACTAAAGLIAYAKGTDVKKPHTLANPQDGETFLLVAMYAAQGYAVVASDYLGYAKSTYSFHPYLHADSEASVVIDSIRAARNAGKDAAVGAVLNGKVMLTGYSQGGHSSMAAHRALERENAKEINVVAGAHLAGPYNLSGSFKSNTAIAGYQYFVPFLITAWQKVYGNVYAKVGDVFKSPYTDYIETLLPNPTLDFTTLVTSGKLPGANGESPSQARDAMFQAAFVTDVATNNDNGVYKAGKKNDLLGWNPKARTLLCGGANDPTVPPVLHQTPAKADFDSRNLTNVTSVDVDATIQAVYGPLPNPATNLAGYASYLSDYHGAKEPPFCHVEARKVFDTASK